MTVKIIDLFAGIGGFNVAGKQLGATTVFASEIDTYPAETYELNYNLAPKGDVTKIDAKDIPKHDILCGGFPCQAFSVAGDRLGFDDIRGTLFNDIIRIAKHHKPKALFLENVKGLINHDGGNTFKVIIKSIEDLGYNVHYKVINTCKYGNLPQNRERVYIVALKGDFKFPEELELTNDFKSFIKRDVKVDDKYYFTDRYLKYNLVKDSVVKDNTAYRLRSNNVRENKNKLSFTLVAQMGTGGHNVPLIKDNYGVRKLTPQECLRLQGYSESFKIPKGMSDSRIYKQAGNSVSVPVIKRILENILERIK